MSGVTALTALCDGVSHHLWVHYDRINTGLSSHLNVHHKSGNVLAGRVARAAHTCVIGVIARHIARCTNTSVNSCSGPACAMRSSGNVDGQGLV